MQVLPGPLPEIRQATAPSLAPIGEQAAAMLIEDDDEAAPREWDVFISHATEDKDEVVRPLAQ